MVGGLPKEMVAQTCGRQVLRSGTSMGANYRAASRARSRGEFISKMHIVQEEADETQYWLELLSDSGRLDAGRCSELMREARELTAIAVSSESTARRNQRMQ